MARASTAVSQKPLRRLGEDCAVAVIRIPKSASTTLTAMALQAFPKARRFFIPNTLDPDGALSAFQRLRHLRHKLRHNLHHHGVFAQSDAFERIGAKIATGDVIVGGHFDFESCRRQIATPLRFVTLIRNPVSRVVSDYAYARSSFWKKSAWSRFDAGLAAKMAARYDFAGYLDFLSDHRDLYGDIACQHIGLRAGDDPSRYLAQHAFAIAALENVSGFARELADKTGHAVAADHLNRAASPASLTIGRSERRKIEQLYANDIILYDWCLAHSRQ